MGGGVYTDWGVSCVGQGGFTQGRGMQFPQGGLWGEGGGLTCGWGFLDGRCVVWGSKGAMQLNPGGWRCRVEGKGAGSLHRKPCWLGSPWGSYVLHPVRRRGHGVGATQGG